MNRSARIFLAIALCVMLAGALVACSPATTPGTTTGNTTGTPAPAPVPVPNQIRIGTLPTEDSLPLWVAEREHGAQRYGQEGADGTVHGTVLSRGGLQ